VDWDNHTRVSVDSTRKFQVTPTVDSRFNIAKGRVKSKDKVTVYV